MYLKKINNIFNNNLVKNQDTNYISGGVVAILSGLILNNNIYVPLFINNILFRSILLIIIYFISRHNIILATILASFLLVLNSQNMIENFKDDNDDDDDDSDDDDSDDDGYDEDKSEEQLKKKELDEKEKEVDENEANASNSSNTASKDNCVRNCLSQNVSDNCKDFCNGGNSNDTDEDDDSNIKPSNQDESVNKRVEEDRKAINRLKDKMLKGK
jgi:hypothetical protein